MRLVRNVPGPEIVRDGKLLAARGISILTPSEVKLLR